MDGNEYAKLCKRTDSPEIKHLAPRLIHGAIGCGTEAGEILDAVKRALFYGSEVDRANLLEELGDLSWYISQILNELGSTWGEIWDLNIKKLKKRYPHQFDKEAAVNRNLDEERRVFEPDICKCKFLKTRVWYKGKDLFGQI